MNPWPRQLFRHDVGNAIAAFVSRPNPDLDSDREIGFLPHLFCLKLPREPPPRDSDQQAVLLNGIHCGRGLECQPSAVRSYKINGLEFKTTEVRMSNATGSG